MKYLEYEVHYETRKQIPVKDKLTGEIHMKDNPDYGKELSKKLTDRGHVSINKREADDNNSRKVSTHLVYELAPDSEQVGQNDYKPVAKKKATQK